MHTKKALIITYYWPPAGGSGVQRWLKFTKYLRSYGWEPIIFTAKNPEVSVRDTTLKKDIPDNLLVLSKSAKEPYRWFRFFTRRKSNMGVGFATPDTKSVSFLNKFSIWIRGNLYIPDARMLWIKPSFKFLSKFLNENPVDIIVSTGPPHSTHLIAKKIKENFGLPWLADFRDPWTNIDYFNDLMLMPSSKRKHLKLEKEVLESANTVVTVSSQMQKEFSNHSIKHLHLITNGYDEDDFSTVPTNLDSKFTITHVGSIPPNRNCNSLWEALKKLVISNDEFASKLAIQLVGSVDSSVLQSIERNGLSGFCNNLGYISHSKGIEMMQQSQVLLLLINQSPNASGIVTGKLFEYMAAKRPILAIGPKGGDTESIITSTKTGVFAQFDSYQVILSKIQWLWEEYQESFPSYSPNDITIYSRRKLTERMATLMDKIANNNN